MKDFLINLFLYLGFCFVIYILFRYFTSSFKFKEGLTDATSSTTTTSDNYAGNAAKYASQVKTASTKYQDQFLISKYRSDYESIILNLDDYLSNLMLRQATNIDFNASTEIINQKFASLALLNQAKSGLNSIMKFVDASN